MEQIAVTSVALNDIVILFADVVRARPILEQNPGAAIVTHNRIVYEFVAATALKLNSGIDVDAISIAVTILESFDIARYVLDSAESILKLGVGRAANG